MNAEIMGVVQVLDIRAGILHSMYTYPDNREGNKKAEAKFRECAKSMFPSIGEEDIAAALCDGYIQTFGTSICITHSIIEEDET